eukprot:TRINITY_DN75024_c0_g1_i1.p1 TRINITY_DN75024_c0_g1~~TRINITY_DN75024_c0_g1_i1.p1  ORF type:complete len:194 (+),score=14.81 TRINITY_DN75024_c0_g1_i1:41-583(+)
MNSLYFPPPPPPPSLETLCKWFHHGGTCMPPTVGRDESHCIDLSTTASSVPADDTHSEKSESSCASTNSNTSSAELTGEGASASWIEIFAKGELRRRKEAKLAEERKQKWEARPLERTDLKKCERQVALYGEQGARRIQQLEAQLNARHDTLSDKHKMVTWPAEPLRILALDKDWAKGTV